MRSLAIASRLAGEHEFHFVGGGHVPAAVAGKFPCLEVPVLRTAAHHRGRVSILRAAGQIAARVTEIPSVKSKIRALIRSWKPDLAICDREFFLPFACQAAGLRCVSLDHSHLLVACEYEVPSDQKISWALAYGSDRVLFDRTSENLIVSFYHPPLRRGPHRRAAAAGVALDRHADHAAGRRSRALLPDQRHLARGGGNVARLWSRGARLRLPSGARDARGQPGFSSVR